MHNYASLQETHDAEEQGILFHVAEPTRSKWNHIEDLDSFFSRMYNYHQQHGFVCMFLQEFFELVQFLFVVFLTTYLMHGIDYSVLFNGYRNNATEEAKKITLNDVILPIGQCMENFTFWTWFFVTVAMIVWIVKLLTRCYHIAYFWDIKQFYNTALNIEDSNLDNLTWHEVQTRIKAVQLEQQMCIHKRELTELDIYHRILRQENYFVAMVNKRLLPPRMKIPFVGEMVYWTKSLRMNIQLLLFWSPWSPFENPWHLREEYKRANLRNELAKQLGTQVLWLAAVNFVLAPIIFVWQVLYTFFSYAEIIKREPGAIGIRVWSLYAKLYLRHFNELDHELHARLTRAYRPAMKYMSAFSSPVATIIAQHIGFLCGSLFAVIVVLTIYDEDVIAVEHVITLMTALGAAIAICRGLIPDETMVWCPETLLEGVVRHTHYLPSNWRGYAHTAAIREEFQQLFQYRVVALLEELLSPLLTPYLLLVWVYPRSLEIVDFFRNFTVSVVGVGDVCSFAQMDVKKHGNPDWHSDERASAPLDAPDEYHQAADGKVELSLVHFATTNPTWVPPEEAQLFIEDLQEEMPNMNGNDLNFTSLQDLLDTGSLNFNDLKNSVVFGQRSLAIISPLDEDLHRKRMSVWMSEGPADNLGPLNMRASCLALHDRYGRRRGHSGRSYEETTPLLISKP